jgi:mono/diheme cytochrome c family protein
MRRRIIGVVCLITLLAVGGYGWFLIRRGFSAHDEPSTLEAFAARTARSLAVPASYRSLTNPYPPAPENVREGLEHFADHCAVCHANNGSGDTNFGRGMYPKPPDMRQPLTQSKTDGEIYYTIEHGIRLSGMPAFGEKNRTDNESTWKLVHFIRHLPKLTPEELREMERLNPKSRAEVEEELEEERFLRGEESPPSKSKSTKHQH